METKGGREGMTCRRRFEEVEFSTDSCRQGVFAVLDALGLPSERAGTVEKVEVGEQADKRRRVVSRIRVRMPKED